MVCNTLHKRPCALYITQENDNEETLQRIFSYIGAVQKNGKADEDDLSLEEKLIAHKLIDSKWSLVIKYRKKGTICCNDIDAIITEVEAEDDVEVKLIVHDYIKRLKANIMTGDMRIDLGEAINDASILAKSRKIPFVTANQLNREAYKSLGEAANAANDNKRKKLDQGKRLDASMVSESQLLIENSDVVLGIHREQAPDKSIWLCVKKFKDRSDTTGGIANNDYFAHPFVDGNGMRLMEDANLDTSYSVESMETKFGSGVLVDEDIEEDDEDTFDDGMSKSKKGTKKSFKTQELEVD